ncbi:MAG: 23S rRNA (adenine(2503)-C(2))-methyltransferase RlmN [Candidatus Promineifilaceae bacterium]
MNAEPQAARLNVNDLSREQLAAALQGWGYSRYHAGRVWHELYRELAADLRSLDGLRPDLARRLQAEASLTELEPLVEQSSADGLTRKFLFRLADGETVETVWMGYPGRSTVCLSTQAGCAMGCVFCATGQMGFRRHLTAGEIVAQVLFTLRRHEAIQEKLRNVVFMGMGEPLHNYDASLAAAGILSDDLGLAIGPRHITLSTVGLPHQIRRLADEGRPYNLAVSLHAADDLARQALVPIGRRWPLAELIAACRYYTARSQRRIFFEWALIAGQNDRPAQAERLGRLLVGMDAHVNLIPLNLTAGYPGRPSDEVAVGRFQAILAAHGLPSTVRQRRGLDIDAGCGQLRERFELHAASGA